MDTSTANNGVVIDNIAQLLSIVEVSAQEVDTQVPITDIGIIVELWKTEEDEYGRVKLVGLGQRQALPLRQILRCLGRMTVDGEQYAIDRGDGLAAASFEEPNDG